MHNTSYEVNNKTGELKAYKDGLHFKTEKDAWHAYCKYLTERIETLNSIISDAKADVYICVKRLDDATQRL